MEEKKTIGDCRWSFSCSGIESIESLMIWAFGFPESWYRSHGFSIRPAPSFHEKKNDPPSGSFFGSNPVTDRSWRWVSRQDAIAVAPVTVTSLYVSEQKSSHLPMTSFIDCDQERYAAS